MGRLDIDCSCTHKHWGRMRGVGHLDIDCSCTHIHWGGCMNREDVFRRGCDSLRKESYITKEEGEYLSRERSLYVQCICVHIPSMNHISLNKQGVGCYVINPLNRI